MSNGIDAVSGTSATMGAGQAMGKIMLDMMNQLMQITGVPVSNETRSAVQELRDALMGNLGVAGNQLATASDAGNGSSLTSPQGMGAAGQTEKVDGQGKGVMQTLMDLLKILMQLMAALNQSGNGWDGGQGGGNSPFKLNATAGGLGNALPQPEGVSTPLASAGTIVPPVATPTGSAAPVGSTSPVDAPASNAPPAAGALAGAGAPPGAGPPATGWSATSPSSPSSAGPTVVGPANGKYDTAVESAAGKYGLDPTLVKAVMAKESQGNPQAQSWAGAVGLMQIKPSTASELAGRPVSAEELKNNPGLSIDLGAKYLSELKAQKGSTEDMLGAYNQGPNADWRSSAEAQDYVRSITEAIAKGEMPSWG